MCWKEMEIDMRTGIQNLNAFADIVPTYDQCCGATTFLGGSGYGRLRSRSWLQAKKAAQAPGKKGRLWVQLLTLQFFTSALNNFIINKNHFWIILSL